MAAIRNNPPPLAIRRSRDPVEAMQDIKEWVEYLSGREEKNDPKSYEEIRNMEDSWKSLQGGDGMLFERNAAKEVVTSVFEMRR